MDISVVVLCLMFAISRSSGQTTKHFRSDYEYNSNTDGFYKLHIVPSLRWHMTDICHLEGAEPMSPVQPRDVSQLHGMLKRYPDLGDYVWVANDGEPHEVAEQEPIIDLNSFSNEVSDEKSNGCVVVTRQGDVDVMACHLRLPFICKVAAADVPYDSQCGVYAKGYTYYPSVGSCYKIPPVAYTWSQAYDECDYEGAHLVILNSQAEAEVVQNIINNQEKIASSIPWFYFAGFRANRTKGAPRVFRTIFNQTLDEAGYSSWSENEPNNHSGQEYCGSIFKSNGKLNDLDCSKTTGFVCEKEVRQN